MRSRVIALGAALFLGIAGCAATEPPEGLARDHPANPEADTPPFEDATPALETRAAPEPKVEGTATAHEEPVPTRHDDHP